MDKIELINTVIAVYFAEHPLEESVAAKDLMPLFIKAGIFTKNHSDGLPIRDLLRGLDDNQQLDLIPAVCVDRKLKNRIWYFVRRNSLV